MAIYRHTTQKPAPEEGLDWKSAFIAVGCLIGATALLVSEHGFNESLQKDFTAHKDILAKRLERNLTSDLNFYPQNIALGKTYRSCEADLCARLTVVSYKAADKKGQAILQFGTLIDDGNNTGNTLDLLPLPPREEVRDGQKIEGILVPFIK